MAITTHIDPDYRIKYKHLFRDKVPVRNMMTSLKDEIAAILKEFNSSVDTRFYAEDRILIPGSEGYLPRPGIIIEHQGKNEDFERDFSNYIEQIEKLAKKLDNKTSIYEYSFKIEFTQKERWTIYEGHYVAYNLSM